MWGTLDCSVGDPRGCGVGDPPGCGVRDPPEPWCGGPPGLWCGGPWTVVWEAPRLWCWAPPGCGLGDPPDCGVGDLGLWCGGPPGCGVGRPQAVVWGTPRTVVWGTPGCGVGGPPGLWCGRPSGLWCGGTPGAVVWATLRAVVWGTRWGGPGARGAQVPTGRGSGVSFSGSCRSAPLAWRLGSEGDSRKPLRRLVRPPKEPPLSGLTSAQAVGWAAGQVSCPVPPGPRNQLRSAPRWGWSPSRTLFLSGGPSRGAPPPRPTRPLCRYVQERRGAGLWRLFIVLGVGWRGSRSSRRAGPRAPPTPPGSSSCAGSPLGWGSRPSRPALPRVGRASRVGGASVMCGRGLPSLPGAGRLWSRPARAHLGQDLRALVCGRERILRKRPAPPPHLPGAEVPDPPPRGQAPPLPVIPSSLPGPPVVRPAPEE